MDHLDELLALATGIRVYHLFLARLSNHVTLLDDLDLLQCCAFVSIRSGMASSTDNQLLDKLEQPLVTVTDDATRYLGVDKLPLII